MGIDGSDAAINAAKWAVTEAPFAAIAPFMTVACLSLWTFRGASLGRPRHNHRHMDRVNDRVADRTQQHARQGASAVTAHDDKLSGF